VAEKGHAAGGRLSEAERDQAAGDVCTAQLLVTVTGSSMIVSLVCPICNRSIPYSDIHKHMSACLQEEYIKEPLTASVQMIHFLCRDASKRKACVDTLCRYLDNIIDHPSEEKYRKIRTGNKTFTEKVSSVSGADLFLEAVGFQQKLLPHQGHKYHTTFSRLRFKLSKFSLYIGTYIG
jgi:UBX domain-containing protein 6